MLGMYDRVQRQQTHFRTADYFRRNLSGATVEAAQKFLAGQTAETLRIFMVATQQVGRPNKASRISSILNNLSNGSLADVIDNRIVYKRG